MSYRGFMADAYADAAAAFADVWGEPVTVIVGGVEIPSTGIWKPENKETDIGERGVQQLLPWPRLDLQRWQFAHLPDPESDLHEAAVIVRGVEYIIAEVRDNRGTVIKCRLEKA